MSQTHRIKTLVRVTHVYQDEETGYISHKDCTMVIHEIDRACSRVPLVGRTAENADAQLDLDSEDNDHA